MIPPHGAERMEVLQHWEEVLLNTLKEIVFPKIRILNMAQVRQNTLILGGGGFLLIQISFREVDPCLFLFLFQYSLFPLKNVLWFKFIFLNYPNSTFRTQNNNIYLADRIT